MEGEEKEKNRLSKELHDGIAQDLLALRFMFQKQGVNETTLYEIDKIGEEIRSLSHQLMPLTLKMIGLVSALEELCEKLFSNTVIKYEFTANGVTERLPLPLEINLYRIVQELFQNIIKHSKADTVVIQLFQMNSFINLIVEDNGTGFDELQSKSGYGLYNLKSRVQMINGNLRFESESGDGTTTIIRVPVKKIYSFRIKE
jgi:signal transduction histidine kinase